MLPCLLLRCCQLCVAIIPSFYSHCGMLCMLFVELHTFYAMINAHALCMNLHSIPNNKGFMCIVSCRVMLKCQCRL